MTGESSKNLGAILGARGELGDQTSVTVKGPGSLITFAPPGSRKVEALLRPNMTSIESSIVVVDPDGVLYAATADRRRAMGQRVLRLDPFRKVGESTDAIDPLDLFDLPGADEAATSLVIANLILPKVSLSTAVQTFGYELLNGTIGYCLAVPEKRSLAAVVQTFGGDDIVYNLAVVLDTIGGRLRREVYSVIASFLQLSDNMRTDVLLAVLQNLAPLRDLSEASWQALSPASVPLRALLEGEPFTVYLIVPRAAMRSQAMLLRLWLGTLLHGLAQRPENRPEGVLFILDECQELSQFSDLDSAMTLRWPTQALLWSLWQSPSQLRAHHTERWHAVIENCAALQALGPMGFTMDEEIDAILNAEIGSAASLPAEEQFVRTADTLMRLKLLER